MSQCAELIENFYRAFQRRDAEEMVSCYHPQVHFTDPVFDLHGHKAGQMWTMLCTQAKDLEVAFDAVDIENSGSIGYAHWEARYTFSLTGRKVHNLIEARFEFVDGLILRHTDHFNFWRWSRQALGPAGWLLGWSPMLHNKIRQRAQHNLDQFIEKKGSSF